MDEIVQGYLFDLMVMLLLLFINGILAMTELAIVSSNRLKMETLSQKSSGAKVALELMDNPGSFFSTIQIGITIIGIISGVFGGQRFAEPMGLWLNTFPWISGYGNSVAFTFVVIVITYVSVVLGELIPKGIAIRKPEKLASFLARPVRLLSKLTYPLVSILDISTKTILSIFKQDGVKESSLTEEEIHGVMNQGLKEGAIDNFEHKVFKNVLQFGGREAAVIMTPRLKVVHLDLADDMEQNTQKILENPHRYYPIFDGGLENFKGIIDAKDALTQMIKGGKLDFQPLIKKAPRVIEDHLGPDLLGQFNQYKTHIALVVDEYGAMQGIITLTDLFETLVGSISRAGQGYDILLRDDGSWLCDGLTPIDEIKQLLDIDVGEKTDENDFNTLAGFLLVQFRHIPEEGEHILWSGFKFEIIDMDGTRIDKVLIQKRGGNPR